MFRRLLALFLVAAANEPPTITRPGVNAPNAQAVQGVTGGVPLKVDATFGGTVTTSCFATAAPPLYVEATNNPLSCDLAGTLRATGGGGGGASDVTIHDPTTATQKLAVDANGRIGVNNFPASQAVTGTFWQATQPVSGTFWQTTQPVSGPLTDTQLRAAAVPVSGTVGVSSLPGTPSQEHTTAVSPNSCQLSDGTAFYNTLAAGQLPTALDINGFLKIHEQGTANVSGTVNVGNFPATQAVTGTFWQATQPVSGTFWQATQPVSGPLTDTQLRAAAVPVLGPLTDTQLRASAVPVSGPLTDTQLRASAVPVSGPLTDTQLRATAVPVSGPLTDTQLRATAVPVTVPDVTSTGTMAALNATVALTLGGDKAGCGVQIGNGPFVGTIIFEGTFDGTNWFDLTSFGAFSGLQFQQITVGGGSFTLMCGSFQAVRTRMSAFTSGSVTATWRATTGPIGNTFSYARIQDPSSNGPVAKVESTFGALRTTVRPPEVLGCYSVSKSTGTYGGLAANTPLYSMRWGAAAPNIALVMKVDVGVITSVSATTAGITERQLIIARGFTVSDTGGTAVTLTGNNQKRRTSMGTSLVTDMRFGPPITAGTRTLDAAPVHTAVGWSGLLSTGWAIGATGSSAVSAARSTEGGTGLIPLLNATNGQDYPITLATNEGIVVRIGAAQPAGSTQETFITIVWCEATAY